MVTREVPGVLIGALLLLAQLGGGLAQLGAGTLGGSPLDQLERSVNRPVPQAPAVPVERPPEVWVPDRNFPNSQGGISVVPGHWERRLPDGQYYSPPVTICNSAGGECATAPAGVRPPPEIRTAP